VADLDPGAVYCLWAGFALFAAAAGAVTIDARRYRCAPILSAGLTAGRPSASVAAWGFGSPRLLVRCGLHARAAACTRALRMRPWAPLDACVACVLGEGGCGGGGGAGWGGAE
jgi:hypothetical protein